MRVSLGNLASVLQENVAEVKFTRRRAKAGSPATRRMLCTNSFGLLNSAEGRVALNFKPPTNYPKYNPQAKNLVVTWDIIMQGFRTISVETCDLVSVIPANDEFWTYFNDKLAPLSQAEKTNFMNV